MASSTAELERLADEAWERIDAGDAEGALEAARRGSKAGRGAPEDLRADLSLLEGLAH